MRVLAWPGLGYAQQPYITQLYTHLERLGADVTGFSPFVTAKKPFDVWHMHWPENRLIDPNPFWAGVQSARLLAEMRTARLRGTKIVWTAHNLKQHEARHPHLEPLFWNRFVRLLDGWTALSPTGKRLAEAKFPHLKRVPSFVIPHGHYRGSYPDDLSRTEARAVLGLAETTRVAAFVGQIRAYKNVPHLIRTFRELPGNAAGGAADTALVVAGRVKDDWLRRELEEAAAGDPRVKLALRFVADHEIQTYLNAADLVALPYKDILNSGSALLGLSFGTPVLVPARGAMEDLQRYAGEGWVRTFAGELSPEALAGALAWAAAPRPPLDLSELDWDRIALRTLRAFTAVCTRVPARAPARAPLPTLSQPEAHAEARGVRRPAPSRFAKPETRPVPKS